MQRSSIIATVVAAGGVLIAGSVASVAVINAASSNAPQSQTVALVSSDQTGAPAPQETSSTESIPGSTETPSTVPEPLPSLTSEPLPEIPEVAVVEQQAAAAPAQKTATSKDSPSKQPKPSASAEKTKSPAVREISADKARAAVLSGTNGGSVMSTTKTSHGGYASWAVKVQRKDGSVVIGYVDRATGTVFDWVVVQKAPAATSSSSPSASDDHDDEHDDDSDDDHADDSGDDHEDDHSDDHDNDDD